MKFIILSYFLFMSTSAVANETKQVVAFPWNGTLYVNASGMVNESMFSGFESAVEMRKKFDTKKIKIQLNSHGGYIQEGLKIISLLQQEKKHGIKIETFVDNGNVCASMCVPLFVQGEVRKTAPSASFMFHAAHSRTLLVLSVVSEKQSKEALIDVFEQAGVSSEWLSQLQKNGIFESPEAYWMSGESLFSENSNVATELLPRLEKGRSYKFMGVKFWL
jgi:hypothetical protein